MYLIGSLLDGIADLGIQAIGHIDSGGGLFEHAKCPDQRLRHAFTLATNIEILQGSGY